MATAFVRCYAELNDLLPPERRYRDSLVALSSGGTVRDLLRSISVPEPGVDLLLVNGTVASFETSIPADARISIYPMFESFDISPLGPANIVPLRHPKFIADLHLGKLASHLRMLGIDTFFRRTEPDELILNLSHEQRRAVLTKDRELLSDRRLERGYFVRSIHSREQLLDVLRRFDLGDCLKPFTRCIECNTILERIDKDSVLARLPERVRQHEGDFRWCATCDRVYWDGSHVERMKRFIADVIAEFRHTVSDGAAGE